MEAFKRICSASMLCCLLGSANACGSPFYPSQLCTRCMHSCMRLLSDVCMAPPDASHSAVHCQTTEACPPPLLSALRINTATLHANERIFMK